MDERLRRLERAHREQPQDPGLRAELAGARLRAGRAAEALELARSAACQAAAPELRARAGEALAAARGLEFAGITPEGAERFIAGTGHEATELALVPAGAFLDEGTTAWRSTLERGGSRASPRRVLLPDCLLGVAPRPATEPREARLAAAALGGQLASAAQWKKGWRGGLFLDGDACAERPNPEPDRVSLEEDADGRVVSPYGLLYPRLGCEWVRGEERWGVRLPADGSRYRVPLERPAQRRGLALSWRLAIDLG